jgi:DNA-binding MarR family transcriptional regulator
MDEQVMAVLRAYPQVYHACHIEHPRARTNAGHIAARDTWILGHLHPSRPVSPATLARHLSLAPSTVSEAVGRLERLGYVARRNPPDDRRRVQLFITRQGAVAMAGASVLDQGRVRSLLALVPAARRRDAVEGLNLLARAARALNTREPKRWNGADD